MTDTTGVNLPARSITAESFAPYGTLIAADQSGGGAFSAGDAHLELSRGTPRLSVMTLEDKPPRFDRITRHRQVTQCLASAGGFPWILGVAPPADDETDSGFPDLDRLAAFTIPGDVAVALHRGTWHAGPFFATRSARFFNLELSDTNEVDHHTVVLEHRYVIVGQ